MYWSKTTCVRNNTGTDGNQRWGKMDYVKLLEMDFLFCPDINNPESEPVQKKICTDDPRGVQKGPGPDDEA